MKRYMQNDIKNTNYNKKFNKGEYIQYIGVSETNNIYSYKPNLHGVYDDIYELCHNDIFQVAYHFEGHFLIYHNHKIYHVPLGIESEILDSFIVIDKSEYTRHMRENKLKRILK